MIRSRSTLRGGLLRDTKSRPMPDPFSTSMCLRLHFRDRRIDRCPLLAFGVPTQHLSAQCGLGRVEIEKGEPCFIWEIGGYHDRSRVAVVEVKNGDDLLAAMRRPVSPKPALAQFSWYLRETASGALTERFQECLAEDRRGRRHHSKDRRQVQQAFRKRSRVSARRDAASRWLQYAGLTAPRSVCVRRYSFHCEPPAPIATCELITTRMAGRSVQTRPRTRRASHLAATSATEDRSRLRLGWPVHCKSPGAGRFPGSGRLRCCSE